MSEGTYPRERLAAYDPGWAERYAAVAATLLDRLGSSWVIEHVGSTSVPGLVAKPVIDLALRVPDGEPLSVAVSSLLDAGWTEPVAIGDHLASYLLDGTVRRAIAHVFTAEQWPTAHVRLFAEWLRQHPTDRDAYALVKQDLVATGVWGGDYTAAKAAFVQDVVNRARAARGLGPVTLR